MGTETLIISITEAEAGLPLHDVLRARLGADAEAPLARGGVWLNGRRVANAAALLDAGAQIAVHRPPNGVYPQLDITEGDLLYEDAWLLALNKRAGWYSGATPWDTQGNALAALGRFLARRTGVVPTLHLAHQLDRDTSGVLLFGRDPRANAPLLRAFASHSAHKQYWCVCAGAPAAEQFALHTGHGRERGGRFRIYGLEEVGRALPDGSRVKEAYTAFTVLQRLPAAALLLAEPRSGRSHQIRLHAAHSGHPLLGDARYGGPLHYAGRALPFHLLHAARLSLPHPATGAALTIEAPLPQHFALIGELGAAG